MSYKIAMYPGSFDPITLGHINILERVSKIFDSIHIVIMNNVQKNYLFNAEERIELTKKSVEHLPNVIVKAHSGLLIDYAAKEEIQVVIRGLRAVSDYEFELQMSNVNRSLLPGLEVFFLTADTNYSFISSSMVKELAKFGGEVTQWVDPVIAEALKNKFNR